MGEIRLGLCSVDYDSWMLLVMAALGALDSVRSKSGLENGACMLVHAWGAFGRLAVKFWFGTAVATSCTLVLELLMIRA